MRDGRNQLCFDRRLYVKQLSKAERMKHDQYVSAYMTRKRISELSVRSNCLDCLKEIQDACSNSNNLAIAKSISISKDDDRSPFLDTIVDELTPNDLRMLIRSEDELAQADHFSRIFPTQVCFLLKNIT